MSHQYLPRMPTWTPEKEWKGEDVFLIGGGSSLAGFDFNQLKGKNTIGCNDAFRLGAEVVKICVFGDAGWWHRNKWELENWPGRLVTNAPSLLNYEIPNLLKMARVRDGLVEGPTLGWNYSTGAAAINLAISLGAHRIFLLGYDLNLNPKGQSHWHNHRPKPTMEYSFQRFLKGFNLVSSVLLLKYPGVKVLNVTDGTSRLNCFEKISFEDLKWELEIREVAKTA